MCRKALCVICALGVFVPPSYGAIIYTHIQGDVTLNQSDGGLQTNSSNGPTTILQSLTEIFASPDILDGSATNAYSISPTGVGGGSSTFANATGAPAAFMFAEAKVEFELTVSSPIDLLILGGQTLNGATTLLTVKDLTTATTLFSLSRTPAFIGFDPISFQWTADPSHTYEWIYHAISFDISGGQNAPLTSAADFRLLEVPEPSSYVMMATGAAALLYRVRKRRNVRDV